MPKHDVASRRVCSDQEGYLEIEQSQQRSTLILHAHDMLCNNYDVSFTSHIFAEPTAACTCHSRLVNSKRHTLGRNKKGRNANVIACPKNKARHCKRLFAAWPIEQASFSWT